MILNILILSLVTLSRIFELPFARANTQRLLRTGGREVAQGHYPLIVLLHAGWLASLWWLAPSRPVSLPLLAILALVECARIWVIVSLGKRWTTRIIIVPGEKLVTRGPYKYLNHPNYAVVIAEIALLPLVFGLWRVALLFTLLNAAILTIRIREENRALGR
jgi:methyltransferase